MVIAVCADGCSRAIIYLSCAVFILYYVYNNNDINILMYLYYYC